MRFNVQFKHRPNGAQVQNIEADTAADAIAQAAKDLRLTPMDVGDPFNDTADYSCILEAVPVKSSLNRWQVREIQTLQKMRYIGGPAFNDRTAQGLAMLYRCAPKKTQQKEIHALAARLGLTDNPEYITTNTN